MVGAAAMAPVGALVSAFSTSSDCGATVVVGRRSIPCSASGASNSTIDGMSLLRFTVK